MIAGHGAQLGTFWSNSAAVRSLDFRALCCSPGNMADASSWPEPFPRVRPAEVTAGGMKQWSKLDVATGVSTTDHDEEALC
jgi:hypothetical protein